MDTRRLGATGPEVSALGLGCMGMSDLYGPADRAESIATIHAALDAGITLLDTGDFYGMGHNELLIGEALRGRAARRGRDQRQVRRAARPGRRAGSATTPARGGEELPRLHAAPARHRPRRRLPARRGSTRPCRSRRPSARSPSWSRPATCATSASRRSGADTIRRAAAVHPIADLQIEYSLISRGIEDGDPAGLPRARHRHHRLRRAVARPAQRPLDAGPRARRRRLPRPQPALPGREPRPQPGARRGAARRRRGARRDRRPGRDRLGAGARRRHRAARRRAPPRPPDRGARRARPRARRPTTSPRSRPRSRPARPPATATPPPRWRSSTASGADGRGPRGLSRPRRSMPRAPGPGAPARGPPAGSRPAGSDPAGPGASGRARRRRSSASACHSASLPSTPSDRVSRARKVPNPRSPMLAPLSLRRATFSVSQVMLCLMGLAVISRRSIRSSSVSRSASIAAAIDPMRSPSGVSSFWDSRCRARSRPIVEPARWSLR